MARTATQSASLAFDRIENDSYGGDFFEPDIMLPEQFYQEKGVGLKGGERKLMSAILSDGVQAYLEQATNYINGVHGRSDAIDWVEASDKQYVFSFDNVCASLGINPEYLRLGLTKYVLMIKGKKRKGSLVDEWKRIRRPRKR